MAAYDFGGHRRAIGRVPLRALKLSRLALAADVPVLGVNAGTVGFLTQAEPDRLPAAIAALRRYTFAGNVRELENAIEHAFVMCHGEEILPQHLPPLITREGEAVTGP